MAARFWSKVDQSAGDSGCWLWTASLDTGGYGLFRVKGRLWKAHRLALVLAGQLPLSGQRACHSCDTPRCCNPAHLRWACQQSNVNDRQARGRWVRGRGNSKLTDDQVRAIRQRLPGPRGWQRDLAEELGVSTTQVSRLLQGSTYRHV